MPTFLTEQAETQICTNLRGSSRHSAITCWPEAILYLLLPYTTASTTCEVLEDLRNLHQGEMEVEEVYQKRLNEAFFRCRNVHREDEKITLYINGLSETIQAVVDRYRERIHRLQLTFESFTHFAKSEDEAYCARARHLTNVRILVATASMVSLPLSRPRIRPSMRNVHSTAHAIEPTGETVQYIDQELVLTMDEQDVISPQDTSLREQQMEEEDD